MTIKRLVSRIIEVRAFVGGWDALVRRSLHVVRRDGFAAFGHKVLTISGVRGGAGSRPDCPGAFASSGSPIEQRYAATCREIERALTISKNCYDDFPLQPKISILIPTYNSPITHLESAIKSVLKQSYKNFELCVVDDCSQMCEVRDLIDKYKLKDSRIVAKFLDMNLGISGATNCALELASGEFIGLLDHDDVLMPTALEEVVRAINVNPDVGLIYTDEFKIDPDNNVSELFPKPDWSPLALLNQMYTGHFSVYRSDIVRSLGGFRSPYDFSQDYDLALRLADLGRRVVHVRQYLYGWRTVDGSAAAGGKQDARISNIAALQDAADRRGWGGTAIPLPTANRLERRSQVTGKVSIVVPSDNEKNIRTTIDSILENTTYGDIEIIVVTNSGIIGCIESDVKGRAVLVAYDKAFNFSDKCNVGAAAAKGAYIVFFNDDVRVMSPDWVESLLEVLTLPGVGIVGPKLLYEDGTIQHAGMVTGVRRLVGTAFHSFPGDTSAHFNFAQNIREVSLICGACLVIKTDVFSSVGGFDAREFPINHSDVDLCFKVRETGLSCVYTAHATLRHIGHMSIGESERRKDPVEEKAKLIDRSDLGLVKKWSNYISYDPYFTPEMRDILYVDSQEVFSFKPNTKNVDSALGHVLIVSHDLSSSGAPKIVFDLARMLIDEGYAVIVASPSEGSFSSKLDEIGAGVIIDPVCFHGEWFREFARTFDRVICNTIVCWPLVASVARHTRLDWYVHESNLIDEILARSPDLLVALKSAHQILAGSRLTEERLFKIGIESHVLPYGIEPHAPSQLAERRMVVGVFGSFEPRKGQDLAVLGMLQLDKRVRRKVEMRLFGRTLDRDFRRAVADFASEDEAIVLRGELSIERYYAELNDVDVVLIPSRDDTLPLVSLDTLALGKVLICSSTTGTAEYLTPGVSGIVLDHNSPAEIAEVLDRLVSDPKLRVSLGKGAAVLFRKMFTVGAFQKRVRSVMNL